MALTLIICYLFSFLVAFFLLPATIHQMGAMSTLLDEPGFAEQKREAFTLSQGF